MLPFDIRHIVVCHVQKKLFTIKNSPVFFGPPCTYLTVSMPSFTKYTYKKILYRQQSLVLCCSSFSWHGYKQLSYHMDIS